MQQLHRIELVGLDGSNLLAFMAAIGTLRVLSECDASAIVQMTWNDNGWWMPVIEHSRIDCEEALVAELAGCVCGGETANPAWAIAEDLTVSRKDFAEHARKFMTAATPLDRSAADFIAAFGSEACGTGKKYEQAADTAFRTMSGAGHQHFLGFMKLLAQSTEPKHIRRALFETWDYIDDKPSMRWDPNDYRPHALRADDPATDPIKTVRGANRLAVEALPCFPAMPTTGGLRTTAFDAEVRITWPIWAPPLSLSTACSLIALGEFERPDRSEMQARGVTQLFRARRFTEGKYRNFSPARALL